MKASAALLAVLGVIVPVHHGEAWSYPPGPSDLVKSWGGKLVESAVRRSLLGSLLVTVVGAAVTTTPAVADAAEETAAAGGGMTTMTIAEGGLTDVYFGVGCFWHIQHEFVVAERELLGRTDRELTSRSGYAGGMKTDKEGRVCYHNLQMIADYGRLGHGEVVGMTIPESSIADFTKVYFSLFNAKTKDRVDPQDRGSEYRSLLGLPGGVNHPLYGDVEAAATSAGFVLKEGKGSDPDTLGKQLVWVYDTQKFPFYQAEVYHQFHNDFQSPPYGRSYNNLVSLALEDGRVQGTGCPDMI